MKLTVVEAFDIPDVFYKLVSAILKKGRMWTIQKGSFEGHDRLEFENVCITISNPYNKPLIPDVPDGIPPPTDMNAVNDYVFLLFTTDKRDYQYTYGERIAPQLEKAIKMLKETPMTNQCTIEVAKPPDKIKCFECGHENHTQGDMDMEHPPCLRLIDCRIKDGALHFFVYFRSWDLWSGLPPNLAGLQILKAWMADRIGVKDGSLNAWSKGLHLYDYQIKLARRLVKLSS